MKFKNAYPRLASVSGSMGKYTKSYAFMKPAASIIDRKALRSTLLGKFRIMMVCTLFHGGGGLCLPEATMNASCCRAIASALGWPSPVEKGKPGIERPGVYPF